MPIVRTYACPQCNHFLEVTLSAEQVDAPAPACPQCAARRMQQEFKPPAIVGSNYAKAAAIAENIAATDYNVADAKFEGYEGVRNKVRYKDDNPVTPSTWGAQQQTLQMAIAAGRDVRLKHGSGLFDVLQGALKNGEQPDLIELSKQRSYRLG